jgi:MFS family permease
VSLSTVTGLIIGAFIVQWATWPWLFYVFTISGAVVFVTVAILSPSPKRVVVLSNAERFKRLDLGGIFLVTGEFFCCRFSTCIEGLFFRWTRSFYIRRDGRFGEWLEQRTMLGSAHHLIVSDHRILFLGGPPPGRHGSHVRPLYAKSNLSPYDIL